MLKNHRVLRVVLLSVFLTLVFFFLLASITAAAVGYYVYQKVTLFTDNAHISVDTLLQTAKEGWRTQPEQANGHINFLILGTDDLANRDHAEQMTDTMMLASLNVHSGQVSLYSLPRDLWNSDYKTKINALYQYGKDHYPTEPQRFPKEILENWLNIPIHHVVVINLDTLAQLIDQMGGLDVTVKDSFVDAQFPRPDVDVTKVHDPKLLYKTVEFKQGVEHMSGTRVLEYVRSRHSADENEGNDVARGARQQEIIMDLVATLKNPTFFYDVARDGRLYAFYQDHFAQFLPITQAIGIAHELYPHKDAIHFTTASPSIFPDDPHGVIDHPDKITTAKKYANQWVYEVRNLEQFQTEVKDKLNFNQ